MKRVLIFIAVYFVCADILLFYCIGDRFVYAAELADSESVSEVSSDEAVIEETEGEGVTQEETTEDTEQSTQPAVTTNGELSLYATAAVLMDGESGRVLYGKNEEQFLANASTTKILTCIVALENGDMQAVATASSYACSMPKVHLGMQEGEQFYLKDLLYSMMLESHNDSAVAIAETVSGSVEAFMELMNEKAKEIGCENTTFLTPNGLDATKEENGQSITHGTTAVDLARIMAYCVNESPAKEQFLEITHTKQYSFSNVEQTRSFSCTNHNQLLDMYPTALSGKTGFTADAGYCYVGTIKDGDRLFVVALLACGWPNNKNYKWSDCRTLFQYGMEHYEYVKLNQYQVSENQLEKLSVSDGQTERMGETAWAEYEIRTEERQTEGILLSEGETLQAEINMPKTLAAPLEEGAEIGSIVYKLDDTVYKRETIVCSKTIEKIDFKWCLEQVLAVFGGQ